MYTVLYETVSYKTVYMRYVYKSIWYTWFSLHSGHRSGSGSSLMSPQSSNPTRVIIHHDMLTNKNLIAQNCHFYITKNLTVTNPYSWDAVSIVTLKLFCSMINI